MKHAILSLLIGMTVLTGCQTKQAIQTLSESDAQTRAKVVSKEAQIAAIEHEEDVIASQLESGSQGAFVTNTMKQIATDKDGNVLYHPDGSPIILEQKVTAKMRTMPKIEGLKNLDLKMAAPDSTGKLQGITLKIDGADKAGTNPDAILNLSEGEARIKDTAGEAVTKTLEAEWKGRIGMATTLGGVVNGILERVTPTGAATGAVKLYFKDGQQVETTEPPTN